ncbi:glycosyltransferase family 61 protein [bacterium]|nr:glycosyltransferase family 61 protein [bacterium]
MQAYTTIYAPDRYSQKAAAQSVRHIKPRIIHIPHGIVVPDIAHDTVGVMDPQFHLVVDSLNGVLTGMANTNVDAPNPKQVRRMNTAAVYCGDDFSWFHFGHFLIDGLVRTYPCLDPKYKNMKFVFCNTRRPTLAKYAFEILGLLGIPRKNIIITNKPIQFRDLYVPKQAFYATRGIASHAMHRVFQTIAKNVTTSCKYDKIYVSRAKLGPKEKTLGEEQIQKIFEQNGYKIIYPETMSIQDQIAHVKNCKYLAGCAGTALHLGAFMRPGGTIIQMKRNTRTDDNLCAQNLINHITGLNFILIWASIERIPTNHYSARPQIIGATPYLYKFFDDHNFDYSAPELAFDRPTWSQYLRQWRQFRRTHAKNAWRRLEFFIQQLGYIIIPRRGRHAVGRRG